MKRLEDALDFLQRQEEKLWFWGVDRAEDMGFSAEFLKEAGLYLDRRNEFPRKATSISLAPEREVPAFVLGFCFELFRRYRGPRRFNPLPWSVSPVQVRGSAEGTAEKKSFPPRRRLRLPGKGTAPASAPAAASPSGK